MIYLTRIIEHHGWEHDTAKNLPVPMKTDTKYVRELMLTEGPKDKRKSQALEKEMGFSYRMAIGELIFALILCRVDISPSVIILSQHNANPAKIHYIAVRQIFSYLNARKSDGIYYWRQKPNMELPVGPHPNPVSKPEDLSKFQQEPNPIRLHGITDSTWGSCPKTRRSMMGILFMIAGGAVYYRTRLHPTVAQSSSESELYSMTDSGKVALYIRSILEELGLIQLQPTPVGADNEGSIKTTMAQKPTRRTRHIELKEMVILQWVEEEHIEFHYIQSRNNVSDTLGNPNPATIFYEHNDIIMGRRKPQYCIHTVNHQNGQYKYAIIPLHRNTTIIQDTSPPLTIPET
mmetsp:Transcript_5974/g.9126  ORF Transcript_5974/g.9126 Transcript_5974/m.9126 type:complete len:347 (-) Transcript_5974:1446-2486(-)